MSKARLFAMLHRQIEGDESLLRLMQRIYREAGLGGEVYPGSVDEALRVWRHVPDEAQPQMVHLARHLDPLHRRDRDEIWQFGESLGARALGLVVHDRHTWVEHMDELVFEVGALGESLAARGGPRVLLEYAAGIPLDAFVTLARRVAPLPGVGICLDTGHIGIQAIATRFAQRRPGVGFCRLAEGDALVADCADDLRAAEHAGIADLERTIYAVAACGDTLHFHLHDLHPLSRLSRYGVCDHLAFTQQVPVPPALSETGTEPSLLGPDGLGRLIASARAGRQHARGGAAELDGCTFTLEIHPLANEARRSLGPHEELFAHWREKGNAERTYSWLCRVVENARLLRQTLQTHASTGA